MTLILAANGRESIWLLADRRLSHGGVPVKEDARKVFDLKTKDGIALLGYSGLGATSKGTEPSEWMTAVLRGTNFSLEDSLRVIADAMKRRFPKHLQGTSLTHSLIATSFLANEPRLYTIGLRQEPGETRFEVQIVRRQVDDGFSKISRPPRIVIGGSGSAFLRHDTKWVRRLLRLIKEQERRRVSPSTVADSLARLNHEVYADNPSASVGPRSIVVWRYRKDGVFGGGGGHQFYTGTKRDPATDSIPTIASGWDVSAVAEMFQSHALEVFAAMNEGRSPDDVDPTKHDEAIARLPTHPDEDLP